MSKKLCINTDFGKKKIPRKHKIYCDFLTLCDPRMFLDNSQCVTNHANNSLFGHIFSVKSRPLDFLKSVTLSLWVDNRNRTCARFFSKIGNDIMRKLISEFSDCFLTFTLYGDGDGFLTWSLNEEVRVFWGISPTY